MDRHPGRPPGPLSYEARQVPAVGDEAAGVLSEIVLRKLRQSREVRPGPEVVRSRPQLIQAPPVKAIVAVDVAQHVLDRRPLVSAEFVFWKELALHEPSVLRQLLGADPTQI